jgi:hypothetical protein
MARNYERIPLQILQIEYCCVCVYPNVEPTQKRIIFKNIAKTL